ncbi:MAG: CotH kinase family protein [Firmicutes bacterium]|nr:CotH kinase family protein [Bacillota bacterium]MCL1953556.1 CotH kinase family protein [Bacillota bacterium]
MKRKFFKNKIFIVTTSIVLVVAIMLGVLLPILLKPRSEWYPWGDITLPQEGSLTLPIIEISTENKKMPQDKVTYINSSFKLSNTIDDEKFGIDIEMKDEYGAKDSVGIRLRGNTTIGYPKKPLRIKFDKKQSMFGSVSNKSWVLLADYLDPSLIKNYSGLSLAKIFDNMPWSATGTHVNLYLNGNYKGVFLLADQVDEKEGRLNLATNNDYKEGQKDYPFLVEMDSLIYEDTTISPEDIFNVSAFNNSPAEIKYPESGDGRPTDATNFIVSYVNNVFNALLAGDIETFENLVDVNSFIDYILVNEIMSNSDAIWKSIYISKKVGQKMTFGPVWDFDGGFGLWSGEPNDTEQNAHFAFETVYSSDCLFVSQFYLNAGQQGFNQVASRFDFLKNQLNKFTIDLENYKTILQNDAKYNQEWYPKLGEIFEKNFNANILFLQNHNAFLNSLFEGDYNNFMQIVYKL